MQSLFLSSREASHAACIPADGQRLIRKLTSSPCCSIREGKEDQRGERRDERKKEMKDIQRVAFLTLKCDPEKEELLLMCCHVCFRLCVYRPCLCLSSKR